MKISVIVPMYNSIKTIKKLIDSVEKQTYKNYEVIMVDDGSTDDTYSYVSGLIKNNNQMCVYKKSNEGPGLARKFGYKKCSGDLLYFVDSDDWITSESAFEDIVNIFNKDIDILFFDREDIEDDRIGIIKGLINTKQGIHPISDLKGIIRPGLGAKIFKKSLFSSDMFCDYSMYEDLYTSYKYLNNCKNFYYENKCFYTIYHESGNTTLSSSITVNKFSESIDILLSLDEIINDKSVRRTLENRMVYMFLLYLKNSEYKTDDINEKIKKIAHIIYKNRILMKH